jgi:outer membrane biosynthesis protein TonB
LAAVAVYGDRMFAHVARSPSSPVENPARVVTLLAGGVVVALVARFWASPPVEVAPKAELERYVELRFVPPPSTPAPAAARPSAGGGPTRRAVETTEVPAPAVPEATPTAVASEMTGDGSGEGAGSGDGAAVGDSPAGSEGGAGGSARSVHWSEVQVTHREVPTYPPTAFQLGYSDNESCVLRLRIDPSGTPVSAEVRRCPEVFRGPAQEAAMRWRFVPLQEDGAPVSAQFDLNFVFKR